MTCYVHEGVAAVGVCAACQKAVCRQCIARESPRLICTACVARRPVIGFEYKSEASLGSLPLLHITTGVDAATGRPRLARGVIAIGNCFRISGFLLGGEPPEP